MSAYLVSSKSLSVIAKSLDYYATRKSPMGDTNYIHILIEGYHQGYFTGNTYSKDTPMAEKLFFKLLEINLLSLKERYGSSTEEDKKIEASYKYDSLAPVVSIPVLIDLLDNWQYQACEGAAGETDFYKLTESLQDKLARLFVRFSKTVDETGHDGTVWGIDDYSELEEVKGAYAY